MFTRQSPESLAAAGLVWRSTDSVWARVTSEEAKRKRLTIEDLFAPHVLFLIVEDPNLRELWAWIRITCPEFAVLVVAPSMKVAVLVNHMTIIFTDAKRMELWSS